MGTARLRSVRCIPALISCICRLTIGDDQRQEFTSARRSNFVRRLKQFGSKKFKGAPLRHHSATLDEPFEEAAFGEFSGEMMTVAQSNLGKSYGRFFLIL